MSIQSDVFDWLQVNDQPQSIQSMADGTGLSRDQVANAAVALVAKNLVTWRAKGIYQIAPIVTTTKVAPVTVAPPVVSLPSPPEEVVMPADVEFGTFLDEMPDVLYHTSFSKSELRLQLEKTAVWFNTSDYEAWDLGGSFSNADPDRKRQRRNVQSMMRAVLTGLDLNARVGVSQRTRHGETRVYFVKR